MKSILIRHCDYSMNLFVTMIRKPKERPEKKWKKWKRKKKKKSRLTQLEYLSGRLAIQIVCVWFLSKSFNFFWDLVSRDGLFTAYKHSEATFRAV